MSKAATSSVRIAELERECAEQRTRIDSLTAQLDWLKRQLFGPKSEKRLVVAPEQVDMGELFAPVRSEAPAGAGEAVSGYRRRRRKTPLEGQVNDSGLQFDERVPVEVIELEAPQLRGAGAEQWEVIGTKETFRLAQRPGSYVVLKYVRPLLKHREDGQLHTPPAPAAVLDKSYADVSFLAGVLCEKFLYHMPLYRQHQKLADAGVKLARSTLTQLTHRAIALLEPIHDAQWRGVLRSKVLAMDETPIKAGREKGPPGRPGKLKQSYFWPLYGEHDEISFQWAPSRESRHVAAFLGDFRGTLLSDGYEAYERYARANADITHALCWAHTRRAMVKAEKHEPQDVAAALEQIGALYRLEADIAKQGMNDAKTLRHRQSHSRPIVDAFFEWCTQQAQRMDLVPSNLFAKALNYATTREAGLRVFLDDPRVPIDTNHLERALRVIPMGRKNYLFCWTEVGAHYVGVIQSLLVTCRLHGVNPYTYLVDVLQRVGQHPASQVDQLTPRQWKIHFAAEPLGSPLDLIR